MSETKSTFRTTRKTVRPHIPSEQQDARAGLTAVEREAGVSFRASAAPTRLLTPLESEKRRAKLMVGTHDGVSSVRKMRKPGRSLSLKPAPKIVTAPKDPREVRRQFFLSSIKSHAASMDIYLLLFAASLALIGVLAVFSASHSYESKRYVIIQAFVAVVGMGGALLLSFFDYRGLLKKLKWVLIVNLALLIITAIFGEGVTGSSNENWLNFGIIKIQPSEVAKVLFIASFAGHLALVKDRVSKPLTALMLFLHAGLIMGLTYLQHDDGTLTIFLGIFVIMLFAANFGVWYYVAGGAALFAALPFVWKKLGTYQQERILVIFDSDVDPNAIGIRQQTARAMSAIRSGGLAGSGYLHGAVTQGNLFAKHTDMIFATICEESGLVGGLALLALFAAFIARIVHIGMTCRNPFGCFICFGTAAMFAIQLVENIGMCLGVMPVIGVTLPFISYGGSSAIGAYLAVGLVLSVSTHKEKTFFG